MNLNENNSKIEKYNILFISNDFNYFVDNNGSFYRMYKNLEYFQKHSDFNVVVLQPKKEKKNEDLNLKKDIPCYYYNQLKLFNNHFIHFLDFNPFYIIKIIEILKKHKIDLIHFDYMYGINVLRFFTKLPISYNAYNVEFIYYKQVGSFYRKIPPFLRSIYSKYIFYLEKLVLKFVKNINAFSLDDKKQFIRLYRIPKDKIHINTMGYKEEIYKNPIIKEQARQKLGIDNNKFVVVFHGFYFENIANKDAIDLIKNDIAPNTDDEKILYVIAGKIPKFENTNNIKFLGYVEDLRYLLYAADIAIVPIFRGSGIRIKMIDYLSANLPMITTKKATLGLTFLDKSHGLYVNEENVVDDFLIKISYLRHHPNEIKRFKKRIKILLDTTYDWNNILSQLESRYRSLIKKS